MSYCLNPNCPKPADPLNAHNPICRHCGSWLVLQKRYRVKNLLGEGGFGKTFEIVDDQGNAQVLKVLMDNNPKAVSLFQREAQVLSRLQHPGTPRVEPDGYFTYSPRNSPQPLHCLVMEKIDGSNLEEWLVERENQPILQHQALLWLKQLVEILHQVHEQQYFHRDIKPSNIMLRPNGQLVLIDFGSVREVTRTYLAKAVGGGQKGTGIISPGYTPPEQANGKSVPQSDFFALGRTFVFLLTGKDPNDFPENPRTGELIWRNKAMDVSPLFADLIDRLMAPFPGNRPQNTREILQRIAELARPMPDAIAPTPPRNVTYRGSPPTRPPVAPLTFLPRSKRKRRSSRVVKPSYSPKGTKFNPKQLLKGASLLFAAGGAILLLLSVQTEIYRYFAPDLIPSRANSAPQQTSLSGKPSNLPKKAALVNTLSNSQGVNALALSPDGQLMASGSVDKTIKIWNASTGKVVETLRGHTKEIWAIAISPDGKTLASGSGDGTINLWDLGSGDPIKTLKGHTGWVLAVAFSPDGKTIASGSADRSIKLWDASTGQTLRTLKTHTDSVNAVAFSPLGGILASGSDDSTIELWDLKTGQTLNTLYDSEGVQCLAFSLDGQTLASGSGDGTVYIWDARTGELKSTLFGHSSSVNAVVFSPDNQILISGGGTLDSTIKLWDRHTGQMLQTLKGHSDTVHTVAISPDGKMLFSGSEDKTIKVWQLQ